MQNFRKKTGKILSAVFAVGFALSSMAPIYADPFNDDPFGDTFDDPFADPFGTTTAPPEDMFPIGNDPSLPDPFNSSATEPPVETTPPVSDTDITEPPVSDTPPVTDTQTAEPPSSDPSVSDTTPADTNDPENTANPNDPNSSSVTETTPAERLPLSLTLLNYTFNLEIGQVEPIKWRVENWQNGDGNFSVMFYSDNTNVAIVDSEGLVAAIGAGRANITVMWGSLSANVTVNVREPEAEAEYLIIVHTDFSLKIGENATIEASVLPEEVSSQYTINYASNAPEVATVDENGVITAKSAGQAEITVQCAEMAELSGVVRVSVSEEVAYDKAKLDGFLYDVKGNPMAGITLRTDNLNAVTDLRGYFVFEQADQKETVLRIVGNEGAQCSLNLNADTTVYLLYKNDVIERLASYEELAGRLTISNVAFDSPTELISVGDVYSLSFRYEPRDASITRIQYESSNEIVAPVAQDGVVTAKSPGEAVIKLILNEGQAETYCTVTVNPKDSTEHSVLIAVIETSVLVIAAAAVFVGYKFYKSKVESKLDKLDEKEDEDDLHDIDL